MKKVLCSALLCALVLTGCGGEEKNPLEEAVRAANERNAGVAAPVSIPEDYRYIPGETERFQPEDFALLAETPPKPSISKEEAREELEWLLRLLRTYYGGYGKFGGDAAFEGAVNGLLAEIGEQESIDYMRYGTLLEKYFSFVEDNHFLIGYKTAASGSGRLYGNEDERFYWSGGQFYDDLAMKHAVTAIGGLAPEEILKLAIDKKGALVYLPYLATDTERTDTALSVTYQGGGERELVLKETDYVSGRGYRADLEQPFREKRDTGLWVTYDHFMDLESDSAQQFLQSAAEVKEHPYAVYDLALNSGGYAEVLEAWFRAYTGEKLRPNHAELVRRNFFDIQLSEDGAAENQRLAREMAEKEALADGYYYTWLPQAQFIDCDGPLLVLLTSSATASCGEYMVDACRNVKNTLVIGGNTAGALSGNMSAEFFTLPYSGVPFTFGPTVFCWDEGYFRENIGFAPDIYLTGPDCEARLEAFLDMYMR